MPFTKAEYEKIIRLKSAKHPEFKCCIVDDRLIPLLLIVLTACVHRSKIFRLQVIVDVDGHFFACEFIADHGRLRAFLLDASNQEEPQKVRPKLVNFLGEENVFSYIPTDNPNKIQHDDKSCFFFSLNFLYNLSRLSYIDNLPRNNLQHLAEIPPCLATLLKPLQSLTAFEKLPLELKQASVMTRRGPKRLESYIQEHTVTRLMLHGTKEQNAKIDAKYDKYRRINFFQVNFNTNPAITMLRAFLGPYDMVHHMFLSLISRSNAFIDELKKIAEVSPGFLSPFAGVCEAILDDIFSESAICDDNQSSLEFAIHLFQINYLVSQARGEGNQYLLSFLQKAIRSNQYQVINYLGSFLYQNHAIVSPVIDNLLFELIQKNQSRYCGLFLHYQLITSDKMPPELALDIGLLQQGLALVGTYFNKGGALTKCLKILRAKTTPQPLTISNELSPFTAIHVLLDNHANNFYELYKACITAIEAIAIFADIDTSFKENYRAFFTRLDALAGQCPPLAAERLRAAQTLVELSQSGRRLTYS